MPFIIYKYFLDIQGGAVMSGLAEFVCYEGVGCFFRGWVV